VITGHAELLLHDLPAWNPARGQVDEIRRAARRAANLTLKLLAFSRSDQSEETQPEILDLNHIVRDLQSLLRKIGGDAGPVRVTCDTTRTLIRACRNPIDQLIMNLCMAVSELLPAGSGVRLTLDHVHIAVPALIGPRRINSGDFVTLLVSPALEEIPPQSLWDNSSPQFVARPLEKAMGLGFAIVQGILEETDGFLEMLTAPGYGPSVRILFPAA